LNYKVDNIISSDTRKISHIRHQHKVEG